MKKLSFLFVALAFVGFLSLNACKSSSKPASTETENVKEAAPAADTSTAAAAKADTTAAKADTTAASETGK